MQKNNVVLYQLSQHKIKKLNFYSKKLFTVVKYYFNETNTGAPDRGQCPLFIADGQVQGNTQQNEQAVLVTGLQFNYLIKENCTRRSKMNLLLTTMFTKRINADERNARIKL